MTTSGTPSGSAPGPKWDLLARELTALRHTAGDISYAEIARLVTERRLAHDQPPHVARVARTTVYDAFRPGRSRVNLALVREIASVLGADDARVDEWVARCRRSADPVEYPAGADAASIATPEPVLVPAGAGPPVPEPADATPSVAPTAVQLTGFLLLCVGLNLVLRLIVEVLHLPIYLDMVGTAIAAIAIGPWRGALVGATTNVLGIAMTGVSYLPFALVNIAGALVWGYGVRRFHLGSTLPRFFALNLLAAVVCSAVAVPILVLAFGGSTGHAQDTISATLVALTHDLAVAVGASNMLISLADKTIAGFVALVAISCLPTTWRRGLRLTLTSTLVDPEVPEASSGRR